MPETERTTQQARQGETSHGHKVFRILVISTLVSGFLLFVLWVIFVSRPFSQTQAGDALDSAHIHTSAAPPAVTARKADP